MGKEEGPVSGEFAKTETGSQPQGLCPFLLPISLWQEREKLGRGFAEPEVLAALDAAQTTAAILPTTIKSRPGVG